MRQASKLSAHVISDNTTSATGERLREAKDKRNSTESTSSSHVRADRASGRASGKRCDVASRNQLPLRVNGVLQPEPSATVPNLSLSTFCIRRARETGRAPGLQRVRRTGSCGKRRGVWLNSLQGNPGRVFFECFDWPFGVSCSKSLGQPKRADVMVIADVADVAATSATSAKSHDIILCFQRHSWLACFPNPAQTQRNAVQTSNNSNLRYVASFKTVVWRCGVRIVMCCVRPPHRKTT